MNDASESENSDKHLELDRSNSSNRKNCINHEILEGHPHELVENKDPKSGEGNFLYVCRYGGCGKTFTKTYNLVYHFRVHTNEKPFSCKYCSKRFSQKGNLGRHLETHQAKNIQVRKSHLCPKCNKGYTSIYNLKVSLSPVTSILTDT